VAGYECRLDDASPTLDRYPVDKRWISPAASVAAMPSPVDVWAFDTYHSRSTTPHVKQLGAPLIPTGSKAEDTMSKTRVGLASGSKEELIASVADRTRRQALLALQDRREPVDTASLATHVAAAVTGEDLVDVTRGDRDAFHVTLVHSHLPRLDEVGLVDWNRDEERVTATDHPAFDDPRFRQLLDVTPAVGDAEECAAADWDAVLRAIQPTRRRLALATLADADHLGRRALARRVVAREAGVEPTSVGEDDLEDVLVALRHHHLPALQRAGLVSVDGETVRYAGHPDLDQDLLAAEPFDLGEASATDDRSADVRTTDGREDTVARGQSLF
jgi:hypothetical protein